MLRLTKNWRAPFSVALLKEANDALGKLYKDGKLWLVEVPAFAAMTQGRTRKEALAMIADWFTTMIDRPGFSVTVHEGKQDAFELSASDTKAMVGLLL